MGSWVSKLLLLLCFLYCKNDCIDSKNVWFLGGRYYLHFSQSPLRKIVRIERLPARYVWPSWFHICTEGTGVEILTQPGKGGEKNFFPVIFPASFQTVPLPLSWFETHPRWPPVTQYAIVGLACEQSSYYHDYTLPEMHREKVEKGISRENYTDRKFFPFSEEFMRSEKHVKHHSYLMCNEANFLLGEHKITI